MAEATSSEFKRTPGEVQPIERPTLDSVQQTWNATETFFKQNNNQRMTEVISAMDDTDKSGYDPKDPAKKFKVERLDPQTGQTIVEEVLFEDVLKEGIKALEDLEVNGTPEQQAEATRLLSEFDKSIEITGKDGQTYTREGWKAKGELGGKYELKYKDIYTPTEVNPGDKEITIKGANEFFDDYRRALISRIIEIQDRDPVQAKILSEKLMMIMTARYLNGETKFGANGKYLVLRTLLREQGDLGNRANLIYQSLEGEVVKDKDGKVVRVNGEVQRTGGIIEGWDEGLTDEERLRFKDNPEAFQDLLRLNELVEITGGDESKLEELIKGIPQEKQEVLAGGLGPQDKKLFENPDRLQSLVKTAFVPEVTTITSLAQEQVKGLSDMEKQKLIDTFKNRGKLALKGVLMVLAVMLMQGLTSEQSPQQ